MIRRPPRSTQSRSSAASDVYKRQEYGATTTQADYWVDGRRSVAEIVDLVECETGLRCPEVLVEHFHLLEQLGLMGLRQVQPQAA